MAALVAGKEGFTVLSNILCILLQTLLQDKLAEVTTTFNVTTSSITTSIAASNSITFNTTTSNINTFSITA